MANKKIICLMGPTASGKTSMAVELVQRFPLDIINVDSAQVYRGLDIGSGKLDKESLRRAPHRLIDICDPVEPYSAAQFVHDAQREIEAVFANNQIPLLVGGTMLYFKALLQGLNTLPSADPVVRADIQQMAIHKGWAAVYKELQDVDKESADRLHPNDHQRIQRAIEVYRLTGKPLSHFHSQQASSLSYPVLALALAPKERESLHLNIEYRFDQMLAEGLEAEVKSLMQIEGLSLALPSMRSVGYRQVWEYLSGEYQHEEMRSKAIAATRQLAKRQLTWLRGWPDIHWLHSDDADANQRLCQLINEFIG